jgi:membrane-associated phospholipid phosphatase
VETAGHELQRTSALALGLTFLAGIAFFAGFSILTGDPATTCLWCETNAFDEAVRNVFYVEQSRAVGLFSHVLSMILAPALAIAAAIVPGYRSRDRSHGHRNLAILLYTLLFTIAAADGFKKLFDRERPGFHHGRELFLEAAHSPLERNVSFFSGDTAIAFTFIAAAFAISYLRGYRPPRWLAISGAIVAILAAVTRISADMHWATDVMAGAVAGILIGAGLPLLLHRRHSPEAAATSARAGGPRLR